MKKRSVFLSFLLVGSLLPGVSSASAPVASAGHGHDHGHAPFETHISEGLPKANDFKDLTKAPPIERDVTTKVLDESGKQVGSRTFKANTGDSISTKASTGSQKVTVYAVADAQYRAKYSDWQTRIVSIIEQADVTFNRDHDVDFVVQAVGSWTSSGSNAEQILSNLSRSFDGRGYDFVTGFTANPNFDAGGIAYVYNSAPRGSAFAVNLDQGTANTAKAATHEYGHNFGLPHDPQGSGIVCLMNYDYSYTVDFFDAAHKNQVNRNKAWYR
ncbi:zinc-dependent metalloprotease [Bacillus sp. FSL K6-4563]|uniref:zinc-dependent metalloprotease n=1 Tax=Bacillus TaxID=1386 RepID=UPI000D02C416|nr:zinc-dependent metalloprotease [Bacillus pumilus]PRS34672.1 peptidase M84 [Bacillus pumilus]PRS63919.1 peptidase M84 [Bacillus pumilus]PRS68826.1 peptidase M84 [Bacillus pumilus]